MLLLLPPAPLFSAWRANCKAPIPQSALRATRRPRTAFTAADDASWGTTVERRKASFTYSPPAGGASKPPHEPPQQRVNGSSKPHRRRHQRQPVVQPDPAANDLHALVAQAATATPTGSGSASSSSSSSSSSSGYAADSAFSTPIYYVPAADHPTTAAAAGMQAVDGRQLRYTAADKLHLTPEAAKDIAVRLRKAGLPKRGQPVLRVFRFGIDDLRLYKALDLAGLEGRIVVVDSMQFADAVLTTRSKRTGKAVNLAEARRAAQAAGVPLFVLRAVSAQRVLEALAPLLGLGQQAQQLPTSAGTSTGQWQGVGAELQGNSSSSSSHGREPRLLRWEEVEGDSSEELLQLLWCPAGHGSCDNGSGSSRDTAVVVEASPRWLAWRSYHQQQQQQRQRQPGDDSSLALHPVAGFLAGAPAAVLDCVRDADVEDARVAMLPANPTQRAGERYMLRKPLRHGARLRRRRLQRDLWQQQAPW